MQKRLSVNGMTCQNCVNRVKKIIEKYEGASDVTVSLENKEAVFSCDPAKTDIEGIVKAINDFGYSAAEKA
jgi:copper ion binding protein